MECEVGCLFDRIGGSMKLSSRSEDRMMRLSTAEKICPWIPNWNADVESLMECQCGLYNFVRCCMDILYGIHGEDCTRLCWEFVR
jgi:hypothetical protein